MPNVIAPSAKARMTAPSSVTLRRGRPGDAAQVLELVGQLGYRPDLRLFDETFAQVVRHPESAVFVAGEGLRIVGYLVVSHRAQIRIGGRSATIDELVVDAKRRGEGIGAALLEAAIAHCASLGCRRIDLATRRTRDSFKRGFYAAHGFVEQDSALLRLEPLPATRRTRL